MESKRQLFSPTPSKFKTQLSIASNTNLDSDRSQSKTDRIQDLYSRFISLNSQVTIDHDQSAFNMIEFNRKEMKVEYDQQLVLAKLKRLQNNAELRRIDMELENRKKKQSNKHRNQDHQVLPEKDKYINTYREITEKKIEFTIDHQNHTDSEDEGNAATERPKGISYFQQLKKHPKILKYTVEQAKSRQKLKLEELNSRKEKIDQFRNELKTVVNATQKVAWNKQKSASPERLAENIFRRFYAKKNKQKSIEQARTDSRVSQFLDMQENIMNTVDQRSLSKENYQKLKQRMNDIATQLYEDEKKHKSKTKLPKISHNRTATTVIRK